jgi:hypothetical protein
LALAENIRKINVILSRGIAEVGAALSSMNGSLEGLSQDMPGAICNRDKLPFCRAAPFRNWLAGFRMTAICIKARNVRL